MAPTVPRDPARLHRDRRLLAGWLFLICFMLLVMIVLGGTTRLTGSGLSIMEWAPLDGVLPPLSQAQWQHLFDLYRQIPQYRLLHEGFGLEGFRQIFWLEWIHRFWGRLIGIAFAGPLLWFWATGRIDRHLGWRLGVLFLLGGLQGAVGWFMVESGFAADSTSVSADRLVVHLLLALVLYATILWTALSLIRPPHDRPSNPLAGMAWLTVGLVALTIAAGGLVAGLHAGLIYNSFPLMEGRVIPPDYAALHPFLRNLTENLAAVQFDHRLLATLTALSALTTVLAGWRLVNESRVRRALLSLGLCVLTQYGLGVATLLNVVPLPLAAAHQAMAVLLLTAALVVAHGMQGAGKAVTHPSGVGLASAQER
jgi:cytochrome c oxidase assembly protein subunit 15